MRVMGMMMIQSIQNRIYEVRGERVMLDYDIALLYEVPTKVFNQAVKRNIERFPEDFMFRLNVVEWDLVNMENNVGNNSVDDLNMRSQIVTASNQHKRNKLITPYAFTEQGIAMLSGVLHSKIAIQMNIAIMRAFVEIRRAIITQSGINLRLKEIKEKIDNHDLQLNQIYDALENLMDEKAAERKWEDRERIGFRSAKAKG